MFAINVEVIVSCNCRSNLWTFRSTEVVARRTKDAGTDLEELMIYFILIGQ